MSDDCPQSNPRSISPHSLEFPAMRRSFIQNHTRASHASDGVPPIHIPVDLDGVVP